MARKLKWIMRYIWDAARARIMTTTTMTTKDAHTYWTAMALEVSLASTQQQQQQDDEKHYKHKFGLCNECGYGLDDESDFVVHPMTGGDTLILCVECWIHPCPWGSS